MRIGIALPTLVDGDGVGNDVLGMMRYLRNRGHDVTLFTEVSRIDEPVKGIADIRRVLSEPDDVLIYHHSIGCDWGVRAVETVPGRVAVKYHNVTPPEFFPAGSEVAAGCAQGLREIPRLAKTRATVWADSSYNAEHFQQAVPGRTVTELPPFHQADHLLSLEPDFRAAMGIDDWATNILLVGRLVPNKNIPLAVRAFAEYRTKFDSRARLIIVGDRPVPEHAAEVEALIHETKQSGHVAVTGKVTTAQLKALYLSADALLVTSRHEGFCVPLVEAMGLRVPVVAVPAAAVPATGGEAVRYAEPTAIALAEALDAVIADSAVREAQLTRGWDRYSERFTTTSIARRFGDLFDELVA